MLVRYFSNHPNLADSISGLTFFLFISIFWLEFVKAPTKQDVVLVNQIVFASFGLLVVWAVFLAILLAVMKSQRLGVRGIILFTALSVTFLICQILAFAIMYKGTGVETKTAMDSTGYIYFSVMTMATVGYGEIYPQESARLVAVFQVLSGYIYMGIFIGVLSSLMVSINQSSNTAGEK